VPRGLRQKSDAMPAGLIVSIIGAVELTAE
jgi:hypothetical protein